MKTSIVWFRNDLRLHDNEALVSAINNSDQVLPIFVFDEKYWAQSKFGHVRTGSFRTRFIIESIENLRQNIRAKGGELMVRSGNPINIFKNLIEEFEVTAIYTSIEVAHEEIELQNQVEKLNIKTHFYHQASLFHPNDLPFDSEEMPDVFTPFRKKVDKRITVRSTFHSPSKIKTPLFTDPGNIPAFHDLNLEEPQTDDRSALAFNGGENAVLDRLQHYFWNTRELLEYKQKRNGLIGADYSSKFSPYLAAGCISPREIYHEVKKFEKEVKSNSSTYWLIFELMWRDFFRFLMVKHKTSIFKITGLWNVHKQWNEPGSYFEKWKLGKTGVPFIDANMRELLHTGFMSNRGRQNVASFLAKDLNIDWRYGADWFESQLIDYDVYSNWGNWNYVSGVGSDPRKERRFNIALQAQKYDKNAEYIKLWVPELNHLDAEKILNWHNYSGSDRKELAPGYPEMIYISEYWR
jgi:deoxyribodipyrimidine photo-lyase